MFLFCTYLTIFKDEPNCLSRKPGVVKNVVALLRLRFPNTEIYTDKLLRRFTLSRTYFRIRKVQIEICKNRPETLRSVNFKANVMYSN